MSALGSLVVSLALDHAKFETGLTRAEHSADKAMRGIEGATKRGGGAFSRFTEETHTSLERLEKKMGSMLTLGRAFAIFEYAGRPMLNFASGAIAAADGINDLSERTGIAVETLSKLSYAAKQDGTDINTVGESFKKLNKLMYDAATGGKESGAMFKALGVDMATLKQMDVEKVIMRLADLTKAMPEGARQGFLENVKKGLGDLTQLFSNGSEGLRTRFDEAVKRGVVLTTENAKAAGEFKDQMDALGMTFTSVAQRIASQFLPGMTAGAQGLADFSRTVEDNQASIAEWAGFLGGAYVTRAVSNIVVAKTAMAQVLIAEIAAEQAVKAARIESMVTLNIAAASELARSRQAVASAAARVASERIQLESMQQMAVYGQARAASLVALTNAETAYSAALLAESNAAQHAAKTQAALGAAQAAGSRTAQIGSGVLTALGGPLGALITTLGLGATAWMVWGNSAESAYEQAKRSRQELSDQTDAIIARQKREASFGTGSAALLKEDIAKSQAEIRRKESSVVYLYGKREHAPEFYKELEEARAKLKKLEAALVIENKPQPAPEIPKFPNLNPGGAKLKKQSQSLFDENGTLLYQTQSEGVLKFLEAQRRDYKELQGEIGKSAVQMVEDAKKWAEEENEHLLKTLSEIGDPRAAWSNMENRLSRARASFAAAGGIISSAEASNQSQVVSGLKSQAQAQMDLRDAIGAQGETIAQMLPDLQAMMMLYGPEQRGEIQAMIDKIREWQTTGQQKGWQAGMTAGLHEYSLAAVDTFATVKDATLKAMQGMEDGIVNFAKTGKLSFKDMASSIIEDLLRMSIRAGITQPLANMFGGWMGGGAQQPANIAAFSNADFGSISAFSTGFADGGIMSAGGPLPLRRYAGGGIANSPQVSLFGEGRLPEAYVPLPDGRSIPVTMQGGGGGVVVNQTIQIDARGSDAGVVEKINQAMVIAKNAAVAEINNSIARGGRTSKLIGAS